MAEIISDIASAGGDYTTYEAWEAAIPANPTDDYTANGLLEESITTNLTISFANANLVTTKITTAIPHYGRFDKGHVLYNVAGDGPVIISHTGPVIIEKIRILKENTGAASALINKTSGSGTITVRQCLMHNKNPGASRGLRVIVAGATLLVYNCMIVDEGATSNDQNVVSNGTLTVNNNTFFSVSGTRDGQIAQYSGTVNQTNNVYLKLAAATVTNVESALYLCTGTKTNNSYWSTTSYGTNPVTSTMVSQLLTGLVLKNNGASTFDLHFKSIGYMDLTGSGFDMSGSYTDDVQGRVRTNWTRGADFALDERFVTGPAGVMLTVGGDRFVVT